jgi:predicted permease
MLSEIRQAIRAMWRTPGFLVVSAFSLAVGCGVTGAAFATVRGWFSFELVIPNAHRLVVVAPTRDGDVSATGMFREAAYNSLLEAGRFRTVGHLFATMPKQVVLSTSGEAVTVRMEAITGHYFSALGVAPLIGRTIGPGDESPGLSVPVVLGESAWRRLFQADSGIVGRPTRLSGLPATIVGVMPANVRGFSVPTSTAVDVWAPLQVVMPIVSPGDRKTVWGQVFGRLSDGATIADAEAEFAATARGFDSVDPLVGASVLPVERGVISARSRTGLSLVGSGMVILAALVLLISCANLANLLLARGASRSSEVAVQMALGARPALIVRRQLLESGSVALLGAILGFVAVRWAGHLLGRFTLFRDGGSVSTGVMVLDPWVGAFFVVLALVAALAVGVLPAMRVVRVDPAQVLASGGSRGRSTGRLERMHRVLVVSQTAGATVLLVLAALLVQSAQNASNYAVAFDARHILVGSFDFGATNWTEDLQRIRLREVLAAATAIPGVEAASASTGLPGGGGGELVDVEVEGPNRHNVPCRKVSVSPGFFQVMGQELLGGRAFDESDAVTSRPVVIVNRVAAGRLWPGHDPLLQRMRLRRGEWLDVVGVVPDMDQTAVDFTDRCYAFVPLSQQHSPQFLLAIRGPATGAALRGSLAKTMSAGVPDVSMFNVTTAQALLDRPAEPARAMATGMAVLAGCGVIIAIVGVYGVMAYLVGLRKAEYGLRKAVGATNGDICRDVCGEAARMVGVGLMVGLPIAYALSVWFAGSLIGITPHNLSTYLGVAAGLMFVGTAAAWWPAMRAAQVEPTVLLRAL